MTPLDLPLDVREALHTTLWFFTVWLFTVEDAKPQKFMGAGTCVTAGGTPCLLSARHVWEELAKGEQFGICTAPEKLLLGVAKDFVVPRVLNALGPREWGPDLALIRVPELMASDLRLDKAFYDIDRRRTKGEPTPAYERPLWAILGAPEEQSLATTKDLILRTGVFATRSTRSAERYTLDYVELTYNREVQPNDLPAFYGGVSGSGLWFVQEVTAADGSVCLSEQPLLEGVAFVQEAATPTADHGVIRCHGRKSIHHLIDTR